MFQPTERDAAILNFFRNSFAPAYQFHEANIYLTTVQIYLHMVEHQGKPGFDIYELKSWLEDNGYMYDRLEGMEIVWLLKENI